MDPQNRDMSGTLAALIVLWPFFLWLGGLAVAFLARLGGCTIWARGPEPCFLFGTDIGGWLYPLWALGFFLFYAVLWVPVGLIILGVLRYARK